MCVSVPSPARARLARLPPGDAFARGAPEEKAESCGPWASAPPAPARASVGKPFFPRQLRAPWGAVFPLRTEGPTLSGELLKGNPSEALNW